MVKSTIQDKMQSLVKLHLKKSKLSLTTQGKHKNDVNGECALNELSSKMSLQFRLTILKFNYIHNWYLAKLALIAN